MTWTFDRHLRHDELTSWLHDLADAHPSLVAVESYGSSHEGRELWLVTVTDTGSGAHDTKPAHWVDASIHATELTATVAACVLLQRLVDGHSSGDEAIVRALRTRTFYVVPRVNPDGAELALAEHPRFLRSSTRPWPQRPGVVPPGFVGEDLTGDGRIRDMRLADPNGEWMAHPGEPRLMIRVPMEGPKPGVARYRVLPEGSIRDHDGWTIPTPRPAEGLDLNRNFPAGWGTSVTGSGDHPLSEPEIDALVRAFVARPNICGSHAFHTSGGVLLRPSSTKPDKVLPPFDVWAWNELGARAGELTSYPVHSVFEDFTWDQNDPLSGAADDWAYEHLGVFSWTTEFWDVVEAATGEKQAPTFWHVGPSNDELFAVLNWLDEHHPTGYADWAEFEHPQLGPVEIGGFDHLTVWTNPPAERLRSEVEPHADIVIHQALCAPQLDILHHRVQQLSGDGPTGTWLVEVGVANTGWFATDVSAWARKHSLVLPLAATLSGDDVEVVVGVARQELGQLDGRAQLRFRWNNDGTPDRALVRWTVRAAPGTVATVVAEHQRAGSCSIDIRLDE